MIGNREVYATCSLEVLQKLSLDNGKVVAFGGSRWALVATWQQPTTTASSPIYSVTLNELLISGEGRKDASAETQAIVDSLEWGNTPIQ